MKALDSSRHEKVSNMTGRMQTGQSRRANYYWLLRLCGQTDRPQTQTWARDILLADICPVMV